MCFLQPLDFIGAFSSRDTGLDDAMSQPLTSSKNIKASDCHLSVWGWIPEGNSNSRTAKSP